MTGLRVAPLPGSARAFPHSFSPARLRHSQPALSRRPRSARLPRAGARSGWSLRAVGDRQATTLDLGLVRRRRAAASRACSATCTSSEPGARSERIRGACAEREGAARAAAAAAPWPRERARARRARRRSSAGLLVLRRPDLALRLLGPATRAPGPRSACTSRCRSVGRDLGATASSPSGRTARLRRRRASACAAGRTVRLDVPVTPRRRGDDPGALQAIAPRDGDPSNDSATLAVALVDFQVEPTPTVAERGRLRRAAQPQRLRRAERGLGSRRRTSARWRAASSRCSRSSCGSSSTRRRSPTATGCSRSSGRCSWPSAPARRST